MQSIFAFLFPWNMSLLQFRDFKCSLILGGLYFQLHIDTSLSRQSLATFRNDFKSIRLKSKIFEVSIEMLKDVKTRKSQMLEKKFKVSGLKPNIATGKWYANESIIACNVSEWVSHMKYVLSLILGYYLRIRWRDDGNIRLSKNNRGIFWHIWCSSLSANTKLVFERSLIMAVIQNRLLFKNSKVHFQQNLSSYSSDQRITDGSNVQCNISYRVSSI